jgi:hypothetical protein
MNSAELLWNAVKKLEAEEWTPEEAAEWLEAKRISVASDEDVESAELALKRLPEAIGEYRAAREGRRLPDGEMPA